VVDAGQSGRSQSTQALEKLCEAYWYPVYAYIRHQGYAPSDAQDKTQGFFATLLEKNFVAAVRPGQGKFRWFLLCTVKRYLANEWHKDNAVKRGGRLRFLSFEDQKAETYYRSEILDEITPEKVFDRAWAMRLLEAAHQEVCTEYAANGKAEVFEQLKVFLSGDKAEVTYAQVAEKLNIAESTMKVLVHRLRRRYREALRGQVAQTVTTAAEVEEEIRQLFAAFSQ
jgi:RNA polymerase sigma-70 factor (ECF subfamily)